MPLLPQDALRRLLPLPLRSSVSRPVVRGIRYNTQATFRTRPLKRSVAPTRFPSSPLLSRTRFPHASRPYRRFQSTQAGAGDANLSLSQRMRKLSREYGWSALGVYIALTALDFPFCFLAVRYLGTDRIGHWEHVVLSYVKAWTKWPLQQHEQDMVDGAADEVKRVVKETVPVDEIREDGQKRMLEDEQTMTIQDHGYKEAEKANQGENASMSAAPP